MLNHRGSVLVVEDDLELRNLLLECLDEMGYDARGAADGIEALESVQELTPWLILLDVNLPRLDGISFLARCRAVNALARTPVIVLCGNPLDVDKDDLRARAPGPVSFLDKPFGYANLIAAVARCVVPPMVRVRRPE